MENGWECELVRHSLSIQDPAPGNLDSDLVIVPLRIESYQNPTHNPSQSEHDLPSVRENICQFGWRHLLFQHAPRETENTLVICILDVRDRVLDPAIEYRQIIPAGQVPDRFTGQDICSPFPNTVAGGISPQATDVKLRFFGLVYRG